METTTPRNLRVLTYLTGGLFLVSLYMVFFYAPREVVMGEVQRVFYYHVSSLWVGMLAFLVTFVAGIIYLRTGAAKWDQVAVSAVEIGLVFTTMGTLGGAIWARPIWNTWWTWDPRLTTTTIMWLLYVAYLMLRQGIDDVGRRRRFAAVYGVVAFVSVPLTFFAIRIWRTIHPVVIGGGDPSVEGNFSMTPRMLQTFLFSLFTFTVLYVTLMWYRLRLERMSEHVAALRAKLAS
ncbi:MAG: cytochrome c biogenesis protein [Anaerolineales bacterium]